MSIGHALAQYLWVSQYEISQMRIGTNNEQFCKLSPQMRVRTSITASIVDHVRTYCNDILLLLVAYDIKKIFCFNKILASEK